MTNLCTRRGCDRKATQQHPHFLDMPVCGSHARVRRRSMLLDSKQSYVFADAQNGAVPHGSVHQAWREGPTKLVQPWRTWEAPGPVTVRKWDGN